jgi:hypothetical protein
MVGNAVEGSCSILAASQIHFLSPIKIEKDYHARSLLGSNTRLFFDKFG